MLSKVLEMKNPSKFQVLFIRNDSTQGVEVHEVQDLDFLTMQERLDRGESIFITSIKAQKIKAPKQQRRTLKTRLVTAFSVDPC